MKKAYLLMFAIMLLSLNFLFIGSVKAYEEGSFGNVSCVNDGNWMDKSYVEYLFDSESGTFSIPEGAMTANEYIDSLSKVTDSSESNLHLIFYNVSEDGKTLNAYVHSYPSVLSNENTKKILTEAGLDVNANCEKAIMASKTANGEGGTPSYKCQVVNGIYFDANGEEVSKDDYESSCNSSSSTNDNSDNEIVEKNVANTASASSIIGLVIGGFMVIGAVLMILKKNGKLPNNFMNK